MNEKLNMQDLVDLLAAKHGMDKKDADAFVKEFFLLIEQALEKDRYVKIKGLGTFKLIDVESRESVKVNTGERFEIQGHTKVSFTPDTALRDIINKPFAHFETVILNENTVLEDTPIEELEEEVIEGGEEAVETPSLDVEEQTEKPIEEAVEKPVESQLTIQPECVLTAEEIIADEMRRTSAVFKSVVREENSPAPLVQQPSKPVLPKTEKSKSPVPYLVTIIIVVLLFCSTALLLVYYPDLFSPLEKKETLRAPASQAAAPTNIPLDTVVARKDTVADVVPEVQKEAPVQPLKKEPTSAKADAKQSATASTPVKPDSVTYKIAGTKTTHTVQEGETLTRISLRFYGTKNLWPYIVQHNRDVIKNPDNVPYGTTLKIPELVEK